MDLVGVVPIGISVAGLAVAATTLYYTNFRKPRLRLLLGSRLKVNHPERVGFTIMLPVTIANESVQPGHVQKVSIALRMPHVEKNYRYLDWGSFVVYRGERRSWDVEELAHPLLIPGKSSVSKVVQYIWQDVGSRYITDVGQYELQVLCWTSMKRKPDIRVTHSLSLSKEQKSKIDRQIGGAIPAEFAGWPPLQPGFSYTTDLVLDQQLPENTLLTEASFNDLR